jgi:hypothetical protein
MSNKMFASAFLASSGGFTATSITLVKALTIGANRGYDEEHITLLLTVDGEGHISSLELEIGSWTEQERASTEAFHDLMLTLEGLQGQGIRLGRHLPEVLREIIPAHWGEFYYFPKDFLWWTGEEFVLPAPSSECGLPMTEDQLLEIFQK